MKAIHLLAGAAVAALAQAAPAWAQDSAVEEVVVTGSRIRGVETVGSNVVSLGAEEIARQPSATVHDLLKQVPQIQGFGYDPSSAVVSGTSGTNTTRGSALNLRGLGPQATLVLLDGRRLPASGVNGTYIDPTSIPAIALDRIEVVADGASAVYGSDAVAGVVNFIVRKNFTGARTQVRLGWADGYETRQFGQLFGHDWGSGHAMIALEHSQNTNLNGAERDYVRSDLRPFGGRDFRGTQCSPGNILVGSTPYAIPAGGVTPATAGQLVAGTRNRCETFRLGDILPEQERNSVVLYAEQNLTESVSVFLEGLYTKRDYVANAIQQGSSSVVATLSVPRTNPFFVAPPGTNPTSVNVEHFFGPELGVLRQHGYFRTTHLAGGFRFELPGEWSGDLTGFYGRTDEAQDTQRILPAALTAALNSTDPATAFNPFGGPNRPEVLAAINSGVFNPYARNTLAGAEVQANGPVWELPGGLMRLAVGAEYVNYGLGAGSRQGDAANPSRLFLYTSRYQKAAFAELFVPIFGDANAAPGLRRLDLSLAYRWDDYSDVGSTSNPKVGVTWSPIEGLLLKGTYGTSFRAPLLQDLQLLRGGAALIVSTVPDPLSPTGTSTGLAVNAGNPNLTPEEATNWAFTFDYQPPAVPGLRLSATWFSIDYDNQVSNPPRGSQTLLDPNYQFLVTRNPTEAQIQAWLAQGLRINGIRPPVVAWLQNAQTQNLGGTKVRGVDFDASYRWDTELGEFNVGVNGSYTHTFKVKITPVAPELEQVGAINFPLRLRSRVFAGWNRGPMTAQVTWNHADDYKNPLTSPTQKIDDFDTVDVHLGYEFEDTGRRWLDGLSISLDAQNLFDADPPFVDLEGGWDPGQASAVGRFVAVTLAKTW
ncbi:TonB-dependent receptor [Phenylobacterium terrae]|uniref:TonB-dependent receptor n=1 Tax=Phenylobacterium terrae TaxID=2665495 RepID=A0ABW4MVR6_9CAUL